MKRFLTIAVASLWFVVAAAVAFAAWQCPPAGNTQEGWLPFIGRFHPAIIHLPIGLLVLVPILEILSWWEAGRALRHSIRVVTALAALFALQAIGCGYLLALSGGYVGRTVELHMWGGIAVAFLAGLCWLLQAPRVRGIGFGKVAYFLTLLTTCGALVWASDQGGKLTHGDTYLTDEMPEPLRKLFGVPPKAIKKDGKLKSTAGEIPAVSRDDALYPTLVAPILSANCVFCHKADITKGGLRLDTFAEVMKEGDTGQEVAPGDAKASELVRRVTLPHDDEDIMPPKGRRPLSQKEIDVLAWWINSGASETKKVSETDEKTRPAFLKVN